MKDGDGVGLGSAGKVLRRIACRHMVSAVGHSFLTDVVHAHDVGSWSGARLQPDEPLFVDSELRCRCVCVCVFLSREL